MSRSTPEWIGKTDDTPVPPRVRLRVFDRDGGRCQCGCWCKIYPGDKWETDHTKAIKNGGENRESNLRTLLFAHHKQKTKADLAEKSKVYRMKVKDLGIRKTSGRPMPGTKRSGIKKKVNGEVVQR